MEDAVDAICYGRAIDERVYALACQRTAFFGKPASPPHPSGLTKWQRKKARWRAYRETQWATFYAETPERSNCVTHAMREKVRFDCWIDAMIAAYLLHRDKPRAQIRMPYSCRLGHIHIGAAPAGKTMLTGTVEKVLHP